MVAPTPQFPAPSRQPVIEMSVRPIVTRRVAGSDAEDAEADPVTGELPVVAALPSVDVADPAVAPGDPTSDPGPAITPGDPASGDPASGDPASGDEAPGGQASDPDPESDPDAGGDHDAVTGPLPVVGAAPAHPAVVDAAPARPSGGPASDPDPASSPVVDPPTGPLAVVAPAAAPVPPGAGSGGPSDAATPPAPHPLPAEPMTHPLPVVPSNSAPISTGSLPAPGTAAIGAPAPTGNATGGFATARPGTGGVAPAPAGTRTGSFPAPGGSGPRAGVPTATGLPAATSTGSGWLVPAAPGAGGFAPAGSRTGGFAPAAGTGAHAVASPFTTATGSAANGAHAPAAAPTGSGWFAAAGPGRFAASPVGTAVAEPLTRPFAAAAMAGPPGAPPRRRGAGAARPRSVGVAVRATVLAVLVALVGGGATAMAMDKTVVVTVDGQDRIVHTFGADVAAVLVAAGITPAPEDHVEPALPTAVASGDHVIYGHARRLRLDEGVSEREVWTTAATVSLALAGLGLAAQPIQMSAAPDADIPLAGMTLQLSVPRAVTLTDGAGAKQQLTTTSGTVGGLLEERKITLGPDDVAIPSPDTPLTDGTDVQVVRNGVGEIVETRAVPPPEQRIADPTLPLGLIKVVDPGKPGESTAIMRVFVSNGSETRREQVSAGGFSPAEPRVVKVGTGEDAPDAAAGPAAAPVDDGTVWDRIAQCESTGNWGISTGNGYYGGLQFDAGTWRAYGGTVYASLPSQASRDDQIAVAEKVRDDRGGGYGAWPACSHKLGLPQ